MNKKQLEKIIYSINFEDVQTVSEEVYGRELNENELKIVEDKIGDYFSWYDSVADLISNELELEKVD